MAHTLPHTLQEQLEQIRVSLTTRHSDQSDINLALEADAWKEQHLKLMQHPMRIDGAD